MMAKETGIKYFKALNVISFILMVGVNALANILPINGITTGKVSDSYPNLFSPAGLTFSIWGVIYLLLTGFIVYQLIYFKEDTAGLFKSISSYFIISSIANSAWIFSWHYKMIPLSMVLMVVILISLIRANQITHSRELNTKEKIFIRLPFSVYFAWITVATIANATVLLVSLGWDGWDLSQQLWIMVVIVIGAVIGVATALKNKDIAYGIVILWGYLGILIRHVSINGFAGKYPEIITVVSIALVVVFIAVLYLIFKGKNNNQQKF